MFPLKFSLTFIVVVLLSASLFAEQTSSVTHLPVGFVDVQDVVPSIIVEMRYATHHNFVGKPIDGYLAPKCLLTVPAAQALQHVQAELHEFSLSLKVYDCYRPQRAVQHFIRWSQDRNDLAMKHEFYPTLSKDAIFARGLIARRSAHSRGSTVDLTIVPLPPPPQEQYFPGQALSACYLPQRERFGDNSLDMGTGFDCFHDLAATRNDHITEQQQANRLLLKRLMEKYGFINHTKEWWHFRLRNEPFPDRYFDFVIE